MWSYCLIMAEWTSDKHWPKTSQSYLLLQAWESGHKAVTPLCSKPSKLSLENRLLNWGDINQLWVSRNDQSAEREWWKICLEKERWEPRCLQKQSNDREWMADGFPDPLRLGCNSSIIFMDNFSVTAQCIPLFLSFTNVSLILLLFFSQIWPTHEAKSPVFESVLE